MGNECKIGNLEEKEEVLLDFNFEDDIQNLKINNDIYKNYCNILKIQAHIRGFLIRKSLNSAELKKQQK